MTPDPKPCPNHSRYTEGCTACFVETGTSAPAIERDAELAALRDAAEKLHEFMLSNPDKILSIPDEIYVPFNNALKSRLFSGTDFAERLRRAEEENAELKARWNRLDIQHSEKCEQLAAVTGERDEARAKLKATEKELFDSSAKDGKPGPPPPNPIGKGSMDEC